MPSALLIVPAAPPERSPAAICWSAVVIDWGHRRRQVVIGGRGDSAECRAGGLGVAEQVGSELAQRGRRVGQPVLSDSRHVVHCGGHEVNPWVTGSKVAVSCTLENADGRWTFDSGGRDRLHRCERDSTGATSATPRMRWTTAQQCALLLLSRGLE